MRMDIKTLRWQKTRKLVSEAGGISRFADRIGRSQQQANRFAGPNPVTGIGNKIARLIEETFDLEKGYLDKPESSDLMNLGEPASNVVDAIRKANQAASAFVEARKYWLKTRPQALYMVRSELRALLIDNGVEIISESDEGFGVIRAGQQLRIDLFLPLEGFSVYRYESTLQMELPDILCIPVCETSASISFYVMPKSVLLSLPDNSSICLDAKAGTINTVSVSSCLNNFSPVL